MHGADDPCASALACETPNLSSTVSSKLVPPPPPTYNAVDSGDGGMAVDGNDERGWRTAQLGHSQA